ncbi:Protein kinase-like domain containing protein, partial [Amanita muscaria]
EVAEGLVYLHTEGVVHGDLKGSNVLLDSEFHVKISDFGSTKHTDSTATKTCAMTIRFSAPELFSDEEDQALWKRTKETDIYAFGCLYYEIHFGILPFSDLREDYRIIKRVKMGTRPVLPPHPRLEDHTARLIKQCWDQDPFNRPRIEDVVVCLKV